MGEIDQSWDSGTVPKPNLPLAAESFSVRQEIYLWRPRHLVRDMQHPDKKTAVWKAAHQRAKAMLISWSRHSFRFAIPLKRQETDLRPHQSPGGAIIALDRAW